MNHWETHLYTFAVAFTQGDKIKPENLQGVRRKAIKHGHTEAECLRVEQNPQHYITTGDLPVMASRTHLICAICGSMDVSADAYAQWDVDAGEWVLQSTYDAKTCERCECRTTLLSIDEATQIGIQTFGMINVADGARLAEESETPEFFDVMVSVSPDERLRSKTELKPQTTARSPHDRQASNTRFDNSSFFDPKSQRRCFDGAFLGQFIMGKLSIYSPQ
jgi:hypothetical protein